MKLPLRITNLGNIYSANLKWQSLIPEEKNPLGWFNGVVETCNPTIIRYIIDLKNIKGTNT